MGILHRLISTRIVQYRILVAIYFRIIVFCCIWCIIGKNSQKSLLCHNTALWDVSCDYKPKATTKFSQSMLNCYVYLHKPRAHTATDLTLIINLRLVAKNSSGYGLILNYNHMSFATRSHRYFSMVLWKVNEMLSHFVTCRRSNNQISK